MHNKLYDYLPLPARPPLEWPDRARVAFYIGLNVEHFEVDKPSTSIWQGTAHLVPDPLNFGWRDYGARVGVWRMIEAFDGLGIRPSVLLNADVCEHYPEIIRAGVSRDWAWLAHGKTNSKLHTGMDVEEERDFLRDIVETIARATGKRPKGWMGPGLTETFETPRLLQELGCSYVLDWCADDQPFALNQAGMLSVPYSVELNDIMLFLGNGFTGEAFYRAVVDQFDQLYADSATSGRVMALALHPFVIGQPFRLKYLVRALEYIGGHDDVWMTTSDDIADHFARVVASSVNVTRSGGS